MSEITIVHMQPQYIEQAKKIIIDAAFELQILPSTSREALKNFCTTTQEFKDLDDIQTFYFKNRGIMFALLDDNKLVGLGGFQKLDNEVCELKRMFLVKKYRGKGLGKQLLEKIIEKAKAMGYKKIKLDIYNPSTQLNAVSLYKKIGFSEIPPYKKSGAKLFMEKKII